MLAATLWSLIGITALGLTRLIYSALIGRAEGPALLGSVNNAVSLSFLATFVTAGATGQAVTKYVARSAGAGLGTAPVRRLLDRLTIGATVAAAGVVVALSPWLFAGHELTAGPAGPAARWRTGALVAVLVLAYAGYTYAKAVLYGYQLARRYAGLEVVADLAALALMVAVLVAGQPGWLLAPLIVGYGGFTLLALRSARGSAGQPSRPAGSTPAPAGLTREIVGFVALTCLGTVASQGFFQACMVVAGKTLTAPGAGLYAAAMTAVTPAFLLPRALALAFFPAAASAVGAGNRASLARQVDVSTRALASLSLPVLVLGAVLAPVLLPAVFGPPYGGAAGAVAVLAAAIWLYVCAVPSVNALSAHGLAWARIPPFASAAGVLLGVGVWLVLMVVLGRRGPAVVAAGYLASTVLQAGVPMLLARRRLGMRPGGFGVRIGSSAVLGAAAVLAWPVTGRLWLSVLVTVVFAVCHPLLLGADVRRLRGWARRSGVEHPSGDDSGRASDDQL
jgi:O-antigen/teichoic acid export membrane protein